MTITSSVFEDGASIPLKYSCEGENINPPLTFAEIPEGTKSLVLLMDDPDVPKDLRPDGMFDHWVVYNLPPETTEISEGSMMQGQQGLNSKGEPQYTGPCPPDREHRYFFKLYALDEELNLESSDSPTKADVEAAMEEHIIEQAELIGLYDKQNK